MKELKKIIFCKMFRLVCNLLKLQKSVRKKIIIVNNSSVILSFQILSVINHTGIENVCSHLEILQVDP